MCNSGVACFHGACVANSSSAALQVCKCEELYAGVQCSLRNGNALLEVPLACVFVFSLLIMGLRVSDQATTILRFPESKSDFFAFPRRFAPTQRKALAFLSKYVGTWSSEANKSGMGGISLKKDKRRILENLFIVVAIVLEIVLWLQVTAIAFLPVVPWPATGSTTAKVMHFMFFRLFILHPQWDHLKPDQFPHQLFYFAAAAVPAGLFACVLLGIKRFPLFKPQPKDSPVENFCTMALRLYSEWAAMPVLIALLLPFECLFLGYELKGIPIKVAVPLDSCFTILQIGQMVLGFAALCVYWLASSLVVFQLNCESSYPVPTLWTDVRYASVVQIVKAPLALINGIRMYGAVLSAWSGVMGLVAAIMDDPTSKITYEVWSVGAMGLSGASLASLLLFHTEDFWFRLGLLASSKQTSSDSRELWSTKMPEGGLDDLDADESDGKSRKRNPFSKLTSIFQVRPRAAALGNVGGKNRAGVDSLAPQLVSVATQQQ